MKNNLDKTNLEITQKLEQQEGEKYTKRYNNLNYVDFSNPNADKISSASTTTIKQETLEEVAPMEELVIILHKIKKNLTNKTEVLTIKLITDTIKTQFVDKELKWQQKTIEEVFEWLTTNNYLTDLKETLIENFKNK